MKEVGPLPGGVYTGGGATVIMDPPPIVYLKVFHDGSSPDRYLRRKTAAVAAAARVLAPKRHGRLARSVGYTQNRDSRGRYAFGFTVYATAPYSLHVHEGTGPSVRRSRKGSAMVFEGTNAYSGRTIITRTVFHPGTRAQPFLQQALIAVMAGG